MDRREVGMGSKVLCTPCEGGPTTMGRKQPGSLSCQIGMADCCVHSYLVLDKSRGEYSNSLPGRVAEGVQVATGQGCCVF